MQRVDRSITIRALPPLVPVLLALVSIAVVLPAAAVEIVPGSGVTLGGWGETSVNGEHREPNHIRNTSLTTPKESQDAVDFSSQADIKLGYNVDDFTLRIDFIASSEALFGTDHTLLEQAFIDWRWTPNATLRAGRFQNTWLGWEGFHTAELWRVNHSAAWDWNVQNHGQFGPAGRRPFVCDGIGLKLADDDKRMGAEFYVVDDVLGDGPTSRSIDKAIGGSLWWRDPEIGRVELGGAWDPRSVNDGDGTSSAALAVDLNADLTSFSGDGWFFAAECQIHRHPYLTIGSERYGNDLVALAMANYAFLPGRASVTAMVDYVERGFATPDNEVWEYSLALLTKPHRQVRLNGEIFYWNERERNADSFGAAVVLQVELP